MQPYVYHPLPTTTAIRLLQICDGAFGDELAISLTVADLTDEPTWSTYECLSYTWHDPLGLGHNPSSEPTFNVKCDEGFLTVTQNLHDALQQFQALGLRGPWWIDAVCINQSDLQERSSQVSFMYEIYSKARRVNVWLGAGNKDSKAALAIMSNSIPGYPTITNPLSIYEHLTQNRREYPPMPIEESEILLKFCNRLWFRRIWVVQEIFAASKVTIYCGDDIISWHTIPDLGLRLPLTKSLSPARYEGAHCAADCIRALSGAYHSCRGAFHETLERFSRFEARDPRDKIFAIIGICSVNPASEWAKLGAKGESDSEGANGAYGYQTKPWENKRMGKRVPLTPEYTSSVQSVFTKAAKIALLDAQDLSPLYWFDSNLERKIHDLPSWVPDYSNSDMVANRYLPPRMGTRVNEVMRDFGLGSSIQMPTTLNGCATYVSPQVGFDARRETVLILHGALWDHVDAVTSFPVGYAHFLFPRALSYLMLEIVFGLSQGYPTQESIRQVLMTTLMAFGGRLRVVNDDDIATVQEDFRMWLQRSIVMLWTQAQTLRIPTDFVSGICRKEQLDLNLEELIDRYGAEFNEVAQDDRGTLQALSQGANGRENLFLAESQYAIHKSSLFITENGYIGVGPEAIRTGDSIFAIAGAELPFVLRTAQDDAFTLVGTAFVHGIMNGELADCEFEPVEIV